MNPFATTLLSCDISGGRVRLGSELSGAFD